MPRPASGKSKIPTAAPANAPPHVHHNVETIASLRTRAQRGVSAHQRRIETITAALGRPRSIYIALGVILVWVGFNGLARPLGLVAFDPPPFSYLQGLVSFSALLMTIMVLTTQNRQSQHAEQRDNLDLQVNLLSEQKAAKLISLVEELRRDLPSVPNRVDPVAEVMTEPLDPRAVMTALEDKLAPQVGIKPRDGERTPIPDTRTGK
jgi:uncharacterized membrane protein